MIAQCSHKKCKHTTCPHFGPHEEIMHDLPERLVKQGAPYCSEAKGHVKCTPVKA